MNETSDSWRSGVEVAKLCEALDKLALGLVAVAGPIRIRLQPMAFDAIAEEGIRQPGKGWNVRRDADDFFCIRYTTGIVLVKGP